MPWQALIGAGLSAISSLFGSDDDDKETTTEIDYEAMARNAERAGFNPLTAMRNGGSAGFVTTHHPGLSASQGIGQALGTFGNAMMAFDWNADERAAREEKLANAQLKLINAQADRRSMWSMDVPSYAGSTRVAGAGATPALLAVGSPPTAGDTTVTNPMPVGSGLEVDPRVKDAEMAETRWGDLVQEIYGIGALGADIVRNIQKYKAPLPPPYDPQWMANPYGGRGKVPAPSKKKTAPKYPRKWGG